MAGYVQQAVDAIIRPPRCEYNQEEVPVFLSGEDGQQFVRHPIAFRNERDQKIVGSLYHSINLSKIDGGPCVIYLHGNASSQLEGQFLVPNFCQYGICVCCFDFAGCGCSEGQYVSLGYFETQDTLYIMKILEESFNLGPFVLWGRSMGAATTLLVNHPKLVARVSDSSFTSVPEMCAAIAKSLSLPSIFVPAVIWFLKREVINAANFDFQYVSPLEAEKTSPVPTVFGHASDDQFIPFDHCRQLYDNCRQSMKWIMALDGGHNSKRGIDWISLGVSVILDQLGISTKNLKVSECRKLQQSTFHFSSFNAMIDNNKEASSSYQNGSVDTSQVIERYQKSQAEREAHKAAKKARKEARDKIRQEKAQKKEAKRLKKEAKLAAQLALEQAKSEQPKLSVTSEEGGNAVPVNADNVEEAAVTVEQAAELSTEESFRADKLSLYVKEEAVIVKTEAAADKPETSSLRVEEEVVTVKAEAEIEPTEAAKEA